MFTEMDSQHQMSPSSTLRVRSVKWCPGCSTVSGNCQERHTTQDTYWQRWCCIMIADTVMACAAPAHVGPSIPVLAAMEHCVAEADVLDSVRKTQWSPEPRTFYFRSWSVRRWG